MVCRDYDPLRPVWEYVQAFAGMPVATIALEFVLFLGFWRFDVVKRHAPLVATIGLALFLG
ncbi:MAG: hypothetical protein ACI9OJ_002349, partial [Myxococcota bacterium]